MKRVRRFCFVTLFAFLILLSSILSQAQTGPERTVKVQGEADPYVVTLYRDINYATPIGTWKLPPGMRMLKIPQLGKRFNSIFLGSKVGAVIFPDANFISWLQGFSGEIIKFGSYNEPTDPYLIPYWRRPGSTPKMFTKYYPHDPCSLIIHRKDIGDFLGVYLESGKNFGQFYPLPEKARESANIYYKIPQGGPFTLVLIPGGVGTMSLYPSLTPPNPNNIAVTITTPGGATVKIPEPNSKAFKWDLTKHGVQQISSLMIQYKGPFDEQAYLPLKAHRAPPAPPPPVSVAPVIQGPEPIMKGPAMLPPGAGQLTVSKVPDVSGQWGSTIGQVYQITQAGVRFEWTVKNRDERGSGLLNGTNVSASWVGPQGRGSAQGKITGIDRSGKATQIDWNNGVRFHR